MVIQFLKGYVYTRKNVSILILFFFMFSSFTPILSSMSQAQMSHAAISVTERKPCGGLDANSRTNKRLLVLLMGLGSYTTPEDKHNGLTGIAKAKDYWTKIIDTRLDEQSPIGSLYGDILYFSYSTEGPEYYNYTEDDSSRSISAHHVELLQKTLQDCNQKGWKTFDLVGHSLGGVTASEYIKKYGLASSQKGWVKHVITLDSPVNGSLLIWCANYSSKNKLCEKLKNFAWKVLDVFAPKFKDTPAAYELADMYETRDKDNASNIQIFKALGEIGTVYRNLTNADDQLVITRQTALWVDLIRGIPWTEGALWFPKNNDGIVDGFGRDFDLGTFDSKEIETFNPSFGHALIVSKADEYPEVLRYIRYIICGGPEGTNNPACSDRIVEPIPVPNPHVDTSHFRGVGPRKRSPYGAVDKHQYFRVGSRKARKTNQEEAKNGRFQGSPQHN